MRVLLKLALRFLRNLILVHVTVPVRLATVLAPLSFFRESLTRGEDRFLLHPTNIRHELIQRNVVRVRDVLEQRGQNSIYAALHLLLDQGLDLANQCHVFFVCASFK